METVTTHRTSDTDRISFSVRSKAQEYGDGAIFHEFRVVMRSEGKVVGIEVGPRRMHKTRPECRAAGYQRIHELKKHRLFIVPVTTKDIENGEERSCQACAISQALWRNQERIGLSKHAFDFRVEPYGFAVNCNGIVLDDKSNYKAPPIVTGQNDMPDLVSEGPRGLYVESMYEWTLHWDDWAESRHMTAKEWNEEHPDDGGKPYKTTPCSFVLDLTEMKTDATTQGGVE